MNDFNFEMVMLLKFPEIPRHLVHVYNRKRLLKNMLQRSVNVSHADAYGELFAIFEQLGN